MTCKIKPSYLHQLDHLKIYLIYSEVKVQSFIPQEGKVRMRSGWLFRGGYFFSFLLKRRFMVREQMATSNIFTPYD